MNIFITDFVKHYEYITVPANELIMRLPTSQLNH